MVTPPASIAAVRASPASAAPKMEATIGVSTNVYETRDAVQRLRVNRNRANKPIEPKTTRYIKLTQVVEVAGSDQRSPETAERPSSKTPPNAMATAFVAIGWPVGYFLSTMLDSEALNAAPSMKRSPPTGMCAWDGVPTMTRMPTTAIVPPTRPRSLNRSTP